MKKKALFVLAVFLGVSGVSLAQQSAEPKKGSPMKDMMPEMMKEKQSGEENMRGMGGMGGMMGMGMGKMMEQCCAMMGSRADHGEKDMKSQKK